MTVQSNPNNYTISTGNLTGISYTTNTAGSTYTMSGSYSYNVNIWEALKEEITPQMLLDYIGRDKLLEYLDLDCKIPEDCIEVIEE